MHPAVPRHILRAIFAAALVASPVAAQPATEAGPVKPPVRQCFFPSQLSSWSEVDDRTVVIRVGVSRNFRLDLPAPCPELRLTGPLGLISHRGGQSICTGDTFDLLVRDLSGQGDRRCNVQSMQPVSREEAATLARRRR